MSETPGLLKHDRNNFFNGEVRNRGNGKQEIDREGAGRNVNFDSSKRVMPVAIGREYRALENVVRVFQSEERPVDDVQGDQFLLEMITGLMEAESVSEHFNLAIIQTAKSSQGVVIATD